MTEKKISFGFKQVKKQPVLLPNKIEEKKNDIELIQCLEGQSIKLINEKEEQKPLVIPLLNSQKTSTALASLKNLKTVLDGEEQTDEANGAQRADAKTTESSESNGQLTIEQRVIKELLNEAKNADDENDEQNGEKLSLPMTADKLPLDGAKESTIDDYDSIPISQFGMAMLRGMGLKDEEIISKKNKEIELRPKGMGLGADKVVKKAKLLVAPAANETLEIKKNAYVRIIGGKSKDLYGQIEGLDDHACRVIVRLALGGNRETLNEFMVQPVSKQEYLQYGKVINSAKYEEYKRKQEEKDAKKEVKKEVKEENIERRRSVSRERNESSSKPQRESSPRPRSRERDEKSERSEVGISSRQRERSRVRSRDRGSRDKRSPSYDRHRSKDIDRSSNRNRYESRRSRSVDKYSNHKPSSSGSRRDRSIDRSRDRSRDDKFRRRREKSKSSGNSSASDSDSSDDSRHNKRSHHKKSKKKHKKKSSKKYNSSDNDDDRSHKKKTKKSKRERSRSRGRR